MATQISFPTSNAVVTTGWTNPTNKYAADAVYATCTPTASTTVSSNFGTFGFDSSIPAGSTINNVTVEISYHVSVALASAPTIGVRPWINGVAYGTELTDNTQPLTDLIISQVYTGLTQANLSDASFVIRDRVTQGTLPSTTSQDYVQVTVNFTPPPAAGGILAFL